MTYKVQIDDVVRDATHDEIAVIDAQRAYVAENKAAFDKKIAAIQSAQTKLKALGLTDDEIKALVG
jgi:hypothetical protein